ncbi:MAG TPA: alpha-L-fucosidase, partial [Bacteroidota bacterium]|nr:alpha-L-fucosidase [Bacteroidota bacterium]
HPQSVNYVYPDDPLVREKLERWRDQKFGMIVHWGLYSVHGVLESWGICSEPWVHRDSTVSYEDSKQRYWAVKNEFNPERFDPDQWANAAADAGMRYLVFTTKHHDGFCMFDTHETDFKISNGPFAANPKSDVAKFVFEAFRKRGFMIGAYFSKPDWHSEYYWWPTYATPNRNVNYDIRTYPWRWENFKTFTFNQIRELMHGYGGIDILWLDGGWVRPLESVTDEVRSWGAAIPEWSQDVDIPRIAAMARAEQPGVLVVDRTVGGPYENYQTPEQRIPDRSLAQPWESCITLGRAWGYTPREHYKSPTEIVHTLIEIVAKGGSMLLGVGPHPDGTLTSAQVDRLREIGAWLKINGEAIYSTRSADTYRDGEIFFTQRKDGMKRYAIVRLKDDEPVPAELVWHGNLPAPDSRMRCLQDGSDVPWTQKDGIVTVTLPSRFRQLHNIRALAFSFDVEKDHH